jgi:hypothetical protein
MRNLPRTENLLIANAVGAEEEGKSGFVCESSSYAVESLMESVELIETTNCAESDYSHYQVHFHLQHHYLAPPPIIPGWTSPLLLVVLLRV